MVAVKLNFAKYKLTMKAWWTHFIVRSGPIKLCRFKAFEYYMIAFNNFSL
jgi:hypothetical protein